MRKTLKSKIYLKKKLFDFKMDPIRTLNANLCDFKKATIELTNIGEEISDENQAVILLNSLPEAFDAIRAAIEYGREDLTLGVVVSAFRSKELFMKFSNKTMFGNQSGDALSIRRRGKKRVQRPEISIKI